MIRNARVDDNQKQLVANLRQIGCKVLHLHQLKNCCDLLVGYKGKLYLFEVKDPNKPPSARKLTEGEQKFQDEWQQYPVHVVHTLDECMAIFDKK